MEVRRSTMLTIKLVILLLTLAAVGLISWVVLNTNVDTTQAEITTKITRLKASSEVYYSRLGMYTGMCNDIGASFEGVNCSETSSAFAFEMSLPNGWFHCVDSRGFDGQVPYSKGNNTHCRD